MMGINIKINIIKNNSTWVCWWTRLGDSGSRSSDTALSHGTSQPGPWPTIVSYVDIRYRMYVRYRTVMIQYRTSESSLSKLGTTYDGHHKYHKHCFLCYLWQNTFTYDLLMIYLWFTYDLLLMIYLWFTYDYLWFTYELLRVLMFYLEITYCTYHGH